MSGGNAENVLTTVNVGSVTVDGGNLTSAGNVTVNAHTGGGYTPTLRGNVTTVVIVGNASVTLGGWYIDNPDSGNVSYLQIFDSAGNVTLGNTTPTLSFGIPAGGAANVPAVSPGIAFASGIRIAATTTYNGNATAATGVNVNLFLK